MDDRQFSALYPWYCDPLYFPEIHSDVFLDNFWCIKLEKCFGFYLGWKCTRVNCIEDVFIVENLSESH